MKTSNLRMALVGIAALVAGWATPASSDPGAESPAPLLETDEAVFSSPTQPLDLDEEGLLRLLEPCVIERALQVARSLIGTPYQPGGNRPGGFDCSGLVQYVFRQVGVELPRSSREQYGALSRVSAKELQPGDLLFFRIARSGISHVGIYVEPDRFIHAPSRGRLVTYDSLSDPYWRARFVGAGRPIPGFVPLHRDEVALY